MTEKFSSDGDHRSYDIVEFEGPPPFFSLERAINMALTLCSRENVRSYMPPSRHGDRAKFVVHPSGASGCQRKNAFSIVEAPRDSDSTDPRTQRIFDIGHESHRRIQGYFFEAWKRQVGDVARVWEDVELTIPYLAVVGELDAIVETVLGHRYLVEIKTMAKSKFQTLMAPQTSWLWQAHLYMKAVGLTGAILFVECRDDARFKEFYVEFDEKLWEEIEETLIDTLAAIESEEPPAPDTSDCYFCNYKNICDDPSEVEWDVPLGGLVKEAA